jgi:hypothetical protein
MSDDPLDFLNKSLRESKIYSGREVTPESAARNFLRQGPAERAKFLNEIDERLESAEMKHVGMSVERASRLHAFRSRLIHAHEQALKVRR